MNLSSLRKTGKCRLPHHAAELIELFALAAYIVVGGAWTLWAGAAR